MEKPIKGMRKNDNPLSLRLPRPEHLGHPGNRVVSGEFEFDGDT
jgi:hypothetical protein